MHRSASLPAILCVAVTLGACAGSARSPDLPADAVPKPEPRSKYGNVYKNGPHYDVLGKRYTVMQSSAGYRERGVASWYGKKFHGNLTSNREVYDMYAMSAAHKTLPLPTYVRVRNLRNNKSIVVRVNDRGPFVHNRIIDLSYVAALKLDMISSGTSVVEVTALNFDTPRADQARRTTVTAPPVASPRPAPVASPSPVPLASSRPVPAGDQIFVQVGAFGDKVNAARRLALLSKGGIDNSFVDEDNSTATPLYRVRIGPVANVLQYDLLVEELEALGILDPYLLSQ